MRRMRQKLNLIPCNQFGVFLDRVTDIMNRFVSAIKKKLNVVCRNEPRNRIFYQLYELLLLKQG